MFSIVSHRGTGQGAPGTLFGKYSSINESLLREGVIDEGQPSLNVGGTILRAGVLDWKKKGVGNQVN